MSELSRYETREVRQEMGIRVHKAMGYAVMPEKAALARKYGPKLTYGDIGDALGTTTLFSFGGWCRQEKARVESLKPRDVVDVSIASFRSAPRGELEEGFLGDHIIYDDEYGIPDVLLFIPPGFADTFKRRDDVIDYTEEASEHKGKDRVVWLNRGLYPFGIGKPPLSVGAMLLYLEAEELWPYLREALYVYWG